MQRCSTSSFSGSGQSDTGDAPAAFQQVSGRSWSGTLSESPCTRRWLCLSLHFAWLPRWCVFRCQAAVTILPCRLRHIQWISAPTGPTPLWPPLGPALCLPEDKWSSESPLLTCSSVTPLRQLCLVDCLHTPLLFQLTLIWICLRFCVHFEAVCFGDNCQMLYCRFNF